MVVLLGKAFTFVTLSHLFFFNKQWPVLRKGHIEQNVVSIN